MAALPLILFVCSETKATIPQFKVHTIEKDSPLVEDSIMSGTLLDLDGDGDVDIIIKSWNQKNYPKNFLYIENLIKNYRTSVHLNLRAQSFK